MRKISNACIVLAIIGIWGMAYIVPMIGEIPSGYLFFIDSEVVKVFVRWIILPLYISFCPVIFIIIAVSLRKISKEIELANFNMIQQVCELEKQIEKIK